jgi:Leucine-rich repeat (LRR) protein
MKLSRFLFTVFIGLLFSVTMVCCKTFKTYYGNTFQDIDNQKIKRTFRLDLSNQNLTELPEKVVDLKELRMINLSGNTELDLEKTFEILTGLPKLEVILLDSLNLTVLPDNFKNLRKINHVSLVNNPELDFAQVFLLMKDFDMEFLNLSHNNLAELPEEISKIKRLRDLKLSYNHIQLSELFLNLAELPKLRSLWLDNNRIETLPPEIAAIRRVVYFYIDDNKLSDFPKEMSQMDRLLVMHAAGNNFNELPVGLTHMPHLMFAILSNNPIETIPPEFRRKDYSLLALVMDGNKLDEAEKKFAKKMFRRFFIFSAR